VYFDAISLREELDEIPARCHCEDADAHIYGAAAVRGLKRIHQRSETEPSGCLARVKKLEGDLRSRGLGPNGKRAATIFEDTLPILMICCLFCCL